MSNPDVIVAGAGPVGLVAALVLAEAGLRVAVLEKRDQLNQASKASTFHPPTLTILERLGTYGPFEADATHVGSVQYRTTERGVLGEVSYDLLKGLTPHPFRKHLEQSRLTVLLLEKLKTCPGAEVHFDAEVSSIVANGDDGVEVNITSGNGQSRTWKARYLVGCDGAHSQVREALGIPCETTPYPGRVLRARSDQSVLEIIPDLAPLTYLVSESHSASFLRMPDCWRIILRMPVGTPDDTAMKDEWILERMSALIPGMKALPRLVGRDVYGASQALAERYRSGNVYLCGDSAHLTNTRGGMNMNAGIHDAYATAHAMVRALRDGDVAGLHRASDERLRIAREMLIPRTDSMVSQEGTWIERVSQLLSDPHLAREHLFKTAMLDMVDLGA